MSARIWTPEQRQRQAEAIRRWQPWSKSSGPKSPEGKARVATNAYTGGERVKLRAGIKALTQLLQEQRDWIAQETSKR